MRLISLMIIVISSLVACKKSIQADIIFYNGEIYTVDSTNMLVEAVAVEGGRILHVGSYEEVISYKSDVTRLIDLKGKFMMPGFIEGHGHFSNLGKTIQSLNLMQTKSWDEIVSLVDQKVSKVEPGEWIFGFGWHQEKWESYPGITYNGYPDHQELSKISPDNPVILIHASGHGLFANKKAMELASINIETPNPIGGAIIRDQAGEAIGVFEERAQGLIQEQYNQYINSIDEKERREIWKEGIRLATEDCIRKGITSFQDAGSNFEEIRHYTKMAEEGKLDLRLWAMIRKSSDEMKGKLQDIRVIDAGDHFFTCRAIKTEIDGALGSFGAWLLEPYADKPDFVGQNTTSLNEVKAIAELAFKNDMQLCVHAIGDRGNREILDMIGRDFPESKDKRWRIEHAQHLSLEDIPKFNRYGVIASMQAIHCTSDSPFVIERLGEKRAKEGAYPWRSLLESGAVVTNGTDTPIEDVDPLQSFYASVTRKRVGQDQAFFPEQKLTREEGIYSYTLANAYAAFEEADKGSIEIGKLADFTVLDHNLLSCSDEEILDTKVLYTIIGGEIKYQADTAQ